MAKEEPVKKVKGSYTADDISVLEGLEPVRKRPGMYIGSTGTSGLHHLVKEIFDNSRDEAMNGHCDRIEIALLPGNMVRVVDNGRGIPVDKHKKTGVSALQTIMTTLHAGGKFGGDGYKASGGLHGVGASVVNALSSFTRAEVHKDGGIYVQEYVRGKQKADVKKTGSTKNSGTIISFVPDDQIFSELEFKFGQMLMHYREQAYLIAKTRVTVIDARDYKGKIKIEGTYWIGDLQLPVVSKTYYFEGGISAMVDHYSATSKPVHPTIFYSKKEVGDVEVEIALRYVDDLNPRIFPFANNIHTAGGGMHVTGFKSALTRLINNYNKTNKVIPEKEGLFDGNDVLEGIVAVVSIKMLEIQFEGQTKDKLGSPEARTIVESVFGETFGYYLEENPDDAKMIIKKIALAMRARKAAKAAKDSILRKGALDGLALPGKLADCQVRNADEAELIIVEGESAGGTAKQGRDRRIQAILPLRGKILNVERARLDKMLANNEVKALVIAMGASIADTFDLERIRYKKIIIATDADVDGDHIRVLLLTLFYRYFKPIIESGYLYAAQPPLFKIAKGKDLYYAYSDDQKFAILKSLGIDEDPSANVDDVEGGGEVEVEIEEEEEETGKKGKKAKTTKVSIQRYKGLGEMNSEELWETTMDPARRVLKQFSIQDGAFADTIFETLMGTDVPSRKAFIQSNATTAEVDI